MKQVIILVVLLFTGWFKSPVERKNMDITFIEKPVSKITHEDILVMLAYETFRREGLHTYNPNDHYIYPYADPGDGKGTYGFGHKIRKGEPQKITIRQAVEYMYRDLHRFTSRIQTRYPNLNYNQAVALASLAYNTGKTDFTGTQLGNEIGTEDIPTIEEWCRVRNKKHDSLKKSREFERLLYKGDYEALIRLHNNNLEIADAKLRKYGVKKSLRPSLHSAIAECTVLGYSSN